MHSRVEHWCRRSSSSSLCREAARLVMPSSSPAPFHARGGAELKPGPQVSAPPPSSVRGPRAKPHLVTSISQALQGQTLALSVEKVDQGLGWGKKGEVSGAG